MMTANEFFSRVKITDHAECTGVIDFKGECHTWAEHGILDGRGVYIEYYLNDDALVLDNDMVDWDKYFIGAWYCGSDYSDKNRIA